MGWVLCSCEIEEIDHEVGTGVNSTLCESESEDHEYGVGTGVNSTLCVDARVRRVRMG